MKRLFVITACLLSLGTFAQKTSGTVVYDEVIALDIDANDLPPEVAAMMPKEHKLQKVLRYNSSASLFENKPAPEATGEEELPQQSGIVINFSNQTSDDKVYVDLDNKKVVEQKDLMGKVFLVRSNVTPLPWKFTGRQKMILGMPCMEAVSEKDSTQAWYTTAIPVSTGPARLQGLPGLVLEAHWGTNFSMVATSISTDPVSKESMPEPKKGKAVTAEQFEKIQSEKLAEMEQGNGGGRTRVVIKNASSR
jgi:GLPGLI family protein